MPGQGRWLGVGLVAPALLVLMALNLFPLVYSVALSFTDTELTGGLGGWVGGANYGTVFSLPRFAAALRTTALFVALAVGSELALGFGLALALRERFRGRPFLLVLLLAPMMLPQAVMGLFWNLVLNGHYGVLNQVLDAIHLPQPQWLTNPGLKFVSILMVDVWMATPFMLLISLAALHSIPPYVYEAAAVDRASRWTVFRRITLPMCAPLLGLAVLLRATDALKQFDLVMAVTGPNDASTQTLSALLYQVMLRDGAVGTGAAYAYVVLVLVIALASIFLRYLEVLRGRQGQTG